MSNRRRLQRTLGTLWHKTPARLRKGLVWLVADKFNVGVLGVIFDAQGRVLLLEHVLRVGHSWALPGGWINGDEAFAQALKREIFEETRLTIETGEVVAVATKGRMAQVILHGWVKDTQTIRPSLEIYGGGFYALSELPKLRQDDLTHIHKAHELHQKRASVLPPDPKPR